MACTRDRARRSGSGGRLASPALRGSGPAGSLPQGFSLVELILALTVFSSLVLGLLQLRQVVDQWRYGQQTYELLATVNERLYEYHAAHGNFPAELTELVAQYPGTPPWAELPVHWEPLTGGLAVTWTAPSAPLARRVAAWFSQAKPVGSQLTWWLSDPLSASWTEQFLPRAAPAGQSVAMATDLALAGHNVTGVGTLTGQYLSSQSASLESAAAHQLVAGKLQAEHLTTERLETEHLAAAWATGNTWSGDTMAVTELSVGQLVADELVVTGVGGEQIPLAELALQVREVQRLWHECTRQGGCR